MNILGNLKKDITLFEINLYCKNIQKHKRIMDINVVSSK